MRAKSVVEMIAVGSLLSVTGCLAGSEDARASDESQVAQDIVLGTPGSFNVFGFAMAAGDLDGDGIDDLAVSAPGKGAGTVYLYRGTTNGLAMWRRINESDLSPSNALVGDDWGIRLAIADVDGDGRKDLIVGSALGRDVAFSTGRGGTVDVLWGGSNGPVTTGSVRLTQKRLVPGNANEQGDRFGSALAVRGVSNGATWLAIGSPGEVFQGLQAGFVHVVAFNGRTPSLVDTIAPPSSVPAGGRFGASLVIRDLDNDGHRDVVVGAPGTFASGSSSVKGHVYVFRGTGTSFGSAVEIVESSGLPIANGDEFGMAIAAGHFDTSKYPGHTGANDPFTEQLIIAAPGFSSGNGRVFRYVPTFNGSGAWTGMHVANGIPGEPGSFGGGDEQPLEGGTSAALVVANLDDDLLDDFVTSSPSSSTGSLFDTGELVAFTTRGGIAEATHVSWTLGVASTGVFQTPDSDDEFGLSLAVGHFHSTNPLDLDVVGGMPFRTVAGVADGDNGVRAGAFFAFTRSAATPDVGWLPTKWFDEGTP